MPFSRLLDAGAAVLCLSMICICSRGNGGPFYD
jgi:hypothetical protein